MLANIYMFIHSLTHFTDGGGEGWAGGLPAIPTSGLLHVPHCMPPT